MILKSMKSSGCLGVLSPSAVDERNLTSAVVAFFVELNESRTHARTHAFEAKLLILTGKN